eukprot:1900677-Pyramimonas_sp.AAC.1
MNYQRSAPLGVFVSRGFDHPRNTCPVAPRSPLFNHRHHGVSRCWFNSSTCSMKSITASLMTIVTSNSLQYIPQS